MSVEDGIERSIREIEGSHYINAPNRGMVLARKLFGDVERLRLNSQTDPLLLAHDFLDTLPRIAGYVIELNKWCHAVTESTPDQLVDNGAQ